MRMMRDFQCTDAECNHQFEELVSEGEAVACELCGAPAQQIFLKVAMTCENMVPTYPGCKRVKAGYIHTEHADHPATKIQSGPGGCQGPPV